MKIFVDDIREAPSNYNKTFRTAEDFIEWLHKNPDTCVSTLSLDHDLGENVMDGYQLVKTLVDMPNCIQRIQFHTDNIIGLKNMYMYVKNAQNADVLPNLISVSPHKYVVINGVEKVNPYFNVI